MQTEYTAKYLAPGDDLADAFAVRETVFVDEQGFSMELEIDGMDPNVHHVVLYHGARAVGTGRLFPAEELGLYVIGRVAVLAEHRGGGTGRLLMKHLETLAEQVGANAVTLGAQCQAQGFYEKLGYEPYGDIYYDEHCPHVHMKKMLGEVVGN